MKRVLILIALMLPAYVCAEEVPSSQALKQTESKSVFKGLLFKVWNKFKVLSPKKNDKNYAKGTVIATAGIRGAETTSSILKPYWKDDKTNDKQFVEQLQDFAQAQTMADDGKLKEANQAFTHFMDKYPGSDLKPNAQFGMAITLGGMGQNNESVQMFKSFVNEHPDHPLAEDARLIISELK